MQLRQYTSILLTTSIFFQSFIPIYGMEAEKAPLTVFSQKGKTGAGTILYALRDGEVYIWLGAHYPSFF